MDSVLTSFRLMTLFSRFHCRLPSQGTVPVRQPVNHVSNLRSPAEILLME